VRRPALVVAAPAGALALAIVAFREFVFKPRAFTTKPRARRRPSTAA
jgi:hypothetical protein